MDAERSQLLVRRAIARDPAALDELFSHCAPLLRRALRRMLGERYRRQHGDSDDAAQDALLVAFTHIDRYVPGEGRSFLAWLLGIAELEMLERLRRGAAVKRGGGAVRHVESIAPGEPAAYQATPSQVARGNELEDRVRQCLARLPEREREVLVLKRYVELDTAAIRAELGLPTDGAARALLSRALARLAEMLGNLGPSGA